MDNVVHAAPARGIALAKGLLLLIYPVCWFVYLFWPVIFRPERPFDPMGYGIAFTGMATIGYFVTLAFLSKRLSAFTVKRTAAFAPVLVALTVAAIFLLRAANLQSHRWPNVADTVMILWPLWMVPLCTWLAARVLRGGRKLPSDVV